MIYASASYNIKFRFYDLKQRRMAKTSATTRPAEFFAIPLKISLSCQRKSPSRWSFWRPAGRNHHPAKILGVPPVGKPSRW